MYTNLIAKLLSHSKIAVFSHIRPDGDCIGSQVGICLWLEQNGVQVRAFNQDLPPEEWDLEKLISKVKEFIYLLEDLKSEDLYQLNKEELKDFLKEQLRNAYDLKEAQVEQTHPGIMREAERFFILQQLDTLWREHLQAMDSLRESVGLRGYGQKDPLIEYKNEGYDMFLDMMINMRRNVIYSMFMFQPANRKVEA